MQRFSLSKVLGALVWLSTYSDALQYYVSNPAQCQPLNLTWSDAKGQLHVLIQPVSCILVPVLHEY